MLRAGRVDVVRYLSLPIGNKSSDNVANERNNRWDVEMKSVVEVDRSGDAHDDRKVIRMGNNVWYDGFRYCRQIRRRVGIRPNCRG